jgi:hypothetical protein
MCILKFGLDGTLTAQPLLLCVFSTFGCAGEVSLVPHGANILALWMPQGEQARSIFGSTREANQPEEPLTPPC